jgi:tRNA dimethylallyltransferase
VTGPERRPVAIVGPTGVGKTAVAVEVCLRAGGELVSIDSRQVYRGIEVASGAPAAAELGGVRAHLVGALAVGERIDAHGYVELAEAALAGIAARGARPVLTAGTGLYLRALLDGWDLGGLPADRELRAELEAAAEADLPALVERLRLADPAAAARVDRRNPVRVVRALELVLLRERGQRPVGAPGTPRAAIKVGLTAAPARRAAWIEARVDAMLAQGLVEEVGRLLDPALPGGPPAPAVLSGIGVREVAAHLRGEIDLAEARRLIVARTRAYARRQLIWFRADPQVRWLDAGETVRSDIVEAILEMLR